MLKDKLSVITITYNAEDDIEKTINSVIGQTYENIEYIIIDGKSVDNTCMVIKKYIQQIQVYISENDNGLYDAMNKGILNSTGDWLFFLNAGDTLVDNSTIEKVFSNNLNDVDLVYGDRFVVNKKKEKTLQKAISLDRMYERMPFGHQALFTKKQAIKDGFNCQYNFVSDFDFVINAYKNGLNFYYLNFPVCNFELGGISQRKYKEVNFEAMLLIYRHTNSMEVVMSSNFYKCFYLETKSIYKNKSNSCNINEQLKLLREVSFFKQPFKKYQLYKKLFISYTEEENENICNNG